MILFQFATLAFAPMPDQEPVFRDDFERYRNQADLAKAYQVWQDGARLNVALEEKAVSEGSQAMRVEMLAPNPQTGSTNGSIYHVLTMGNRNWSGAGGLRLWVKNVSDESLLLSVNFKERFNEYWAVSQGGIFLLENPAGQYRRRDIEFGNLVIPPEYSGYVVVPFASFSVPDWNTARGDEVMDLSAIESFAFGVTVPGSFPHIFILDEISVLGQAEYVYLQIKGADNILAPTSGEHREPFSAYINEAVSGSSRPVAAEWRVDDAPDETIAIDADGWLSVPAGSAGGALTLTATYRDDQGIFIDSHTVMLTGDAPGEAEQPDEAKSAAPTAIPPEMSDYERFSLEFEAWAAQNRPLFVLLSIAAVLLFLAILTSFQKRIK